MSAAPQVTPPDALSGFLHFGYLPWADKDFIRPLVDVASPATAFCRLGKLGSSAGEEIKDSHPYRDPVSNLVKNHAVWSVGDI